MTTTNPLVEESTARDDAADAPTPRTVVAEIVTDYTRLTDWPVFCAIAECSEATIHRVRP